MQSVMVLGEKETFIIRVLVKKLNDAGLSAEFVPATVNDINDRWNDFRILTYYFETDEELPDEVIRFLDDRFNESEKKIVLIGDAEDTKQLSEALLGDTVAKVFTRPLDNEKYISTMTMLLGEIENFTQKKSILIVDDDPTYLGLVREWLKDDYRVNMANSGLQAIKWLGKNKVDLILLDHEMPITNGPEVLSMLRSEDETKDIPVIFLTGKGDKASVMQVVSLKPEGYFLKTVKKPELLEKLNEFFESREE
ncbi:MAG: response regulator [Lachnospiraceae bacterium]|nr:response regulator [Lachnospiraceae bacterium]